MRSLALALLLTSALALPAMAQKKEPEKKAAIPANTFFKGQQANQYLGRERLIGAKVVDKDGATVGTIDDIIFNTSNQIDGVIMGIGGILGVGEKKIGVRIGALKITTTDGKTTVSFPTATKEMLGAVEAYQRATPPAKK